MRVLMLLENNPYPQDVRVRLEAQTLTGAGHHVVVVAPRGDGQPARETVDGVEVRRFRLPAMGEGARGIALEYLVANAALHARAVAGLARGADVVHLHNPPDTLFAVAWLAHALRRRVVFDQHDVSPELFETKFGASRVVGVLRWLERRTARAADATLSVNASLREVLRARTGVDPERMAVVRNAPPAAMLAARTPTRPGALEEPRLVFLGSMETQDGVHALPEVMRLLRDEHGLPGARLTVLGDGGARESVEHAAAALGVADRIDFLGRVPHDDVSRHLAGADICLEPAPLNEMNHRCSMVKVYEYLAAGRAIVSTDLEEVRALGDDAIAYTTGDRPADLAAVAARLARDGAERVRRAGASAVQAQRFTWEGTSAPAIVAVYEKLSAPG